MMERWELPGIGRRGFEQRQIGNYSSKTNPDKNYAIAAFFSFVKGGQPSAFFKLAATLMTKTR